MATEIRLTTTGIPSAPDPIAIADFGLMEFPHPTNNFNLMPYVSLDEINSSEELALYVSNGWVALSDADGNPVAIGDYQVGDFGSQYQIQESLGESGTTSKVNYPSTKLTMGVGALPAGKYLLWFACETTNTDKKEVYVAIKQNYTVKQSRQYKVAEKNMYTDYNGFLELDNFTGNSTFRILLARKDKGTAKIKNAKMVLWRVS